MTTPPVSVTTKVHKSLRAKLLHVATAYRMVQNSDEISKLVLRRIRRRFIAKVDADGRPWPDYSPNTKKRAAGGLLYGTGALFRSIRRANNTDFDKGAVSTGAGFKITADAKSKHDGKTKYGFVLNFGSKKSNIPARNFMSLGRNDHRAVLRKFKLLVDARARKL